MSYEQLEAATLQANALGLLNDASILPSLALREDPRLVLDTIQQFACQLSSNAGGITSLATVMSRRGRSPFVDIGIAAVALGFLAGISGPLLANTIARQMQFGGGSANLSWQGDIPAFAVGEGDWSQAIPRINDDPPENCEDDRLEGISSRNFNLLGGFSVAFDALRDLVSPSQGQGIDANFSQNDWAYSNTCDGGLHWNIPGIGGWSDADGLIATIRCCPCCDDSFGQVIYSWNCHLNPKFGSLMGR